MIKQQELRIGNHFKWSDNTLIGSGTGVVTIYNMAYYRHMDPILITPEWLLKHGFYKDGEYYSRGVNDYKLCLKYRDWAKNWALYHEFTDSPDPKDDGVKYPISFDYEYVHQIENLWFILVHEELPIK